VDSKQQAIELQSNELLPVLLDELKADILQQFPSTHEDDLAALQLEYSLVDKLASKLDNLLHREAGI
jgi:hypothetical protein